MKIKLHFESKFLFFIFLILLVALILFLSSIINTNYSLSSLLKNNDRFFKMDQIIQISPYIKLEFLHFAIFIIFFGSGILYLIFYLIDKKSIEIKNLGIFSFAAALYIIYHTSIKQYIFNSPGLWFNLKIVSIMFINHAVIDYAFATYKTKTNILKVLYKISTLLPFIWGGMLFFSILLKSFSLIS